MTRSRLFSPLAFVLALWLGIGSFVTVAVANDMALKMAMSGGISSTDIDMCPACDDDAGDKQIADCLHYCNFVQGAVFPPASALRTTSLTKFAASPVSAPLGLSSGVDPSPPKTSILR